MPSWKGSQATDHSKRYRTRRMYPDPLGTCERCGERQATDRHHIDGNLDDNRRQNIEFICRECHMLHHGDKDYNCAACGRESKPLRRGMCNNCYRKKDKELKEMAEAL